MKKILIVVFLLSIGMVSAGIVDEINIGDVSSEAGHWLWDWGPVEPSAHGGSWGGGDDGTIRVVWTKDDGNEATFILVNTKCHNWFCVMKDKQAEELEMRVLDGFADDSFIVRVNGRPVYRYKDSSNVEVWKTHNIKLNGLLRGMPILFVKIKAMGQEWSSFDTYGQLGISYVALKD